MVGFDVGAVPFNSDGWGPLDTAAPLLSDYLTNLPFAPFNHSEKLGRITDWIPKTMNPSRNLNPRNPFDTVFDYSIEDEDSSFRLVDGKPAPRPKFGPKWRFQQQRQLPQCHNEEVEARKHEAEKELAARRSLHAARRKSLTACRKSLTACRKSLATCRKLF